MKKSLETFEKVLTPHCLFAFLLGSYGTPRFTEASDIDLAAYFAQEPSLDLRLKLMSGLSEALDRDVELAVLNKVDPIFGRQVVETGRLIYSQEPGILLGWKEKILSEYPDFKYSRRIIETNLLRKKRND